ncbi:MAG: class A beta-lactamase [Gemmatimonadetes bacterium]|nr:class A beta-lactamase [Gemmatimonadota bacterium]
MRKTGCKVRGVGCDGLLVWGLMALAPSGPLVAQSVCRGTRDARLARLEAEIGRLAQPAGGRVGVAAFHIESGRGVCMNASEAFPMASTFKVPLAVKLLERVDRGELRLDSMITLQPGDLRPGSGTLSDLFDDPGVTLSIRNLMELMLIISDNSATDVLLRVAGGPEAVTAKMRSLGLGAIRVDRSTLMLITDWLGAADSINESNWTPARGRAVFSTLAQARQDSAAALFDRDPRDTATPEAMAALLVRLWRGELLSAASTDLLLDIMGRATTGPGRLRGMLTPDAHVAHKTGTIGSVTNDIGIVPLPQNGGRVAIAVFVKGSTRPLEERERAIAHIARAVHDYFLFNPAN